MPEPIAAQVFEEWRQTYPANHPYRMYGGVPHGPYTG